MGKMSVLAVLDFFLFGFSFYYVFLGQIEEAMLQRLTIQICLGEVCKKSLERMVRMQWDLGAAQMWWGNTTSLLKRKQNKT